MVMLVNFNPNNKAVGLRRILLAGGNSLRALKWLVKNEAAFKQELVLLLLSIPFSFFITDNRLTQTLLIASIVLILMMEIVNTAIEVVVDRISLEMHDLSGLAKDLGSLLVLFSMALSIIVWSICVWDAVFE